MNDYNMQRPLRAIAVFALAFGIPIMATLGPSPTFAQQHGSDTNAAATSGGGGHDTTSSAASTSGAGAGSVNGGNAGGGGGSAGGGGSGGGSGGGGGGGSSGGKPTEGTGNNLSFPTIAADGFSILPIAASQLTVPYEGPFTGLTADELAALQGSTWYAQKTTGNVWQADVLTVPSGGTIDVYGIDWGDNVESVSPLVGQPYRLEVTLYASTTAQLAYTMRVLANASSPDEVQGTNGVTYMSVLQTVASSRPTLVIQYLGDATTSDLVWNGSAWMRGDQVLPQTAIKFGPELNVAGKYVYGVSEGGWRPVETGYYRLTFYAPASDIKFANAIIGNVADWVNGPTATGETSETGAAAPVVDAIHNLTYVDIRVVAGREGESSGGSGGGGGETTTTDAAAITTTSDALEKTTVSSDSVAAAEPIVATSDTCTPYLTEYLGKGRNNSVDQVILLQKFLNDTLGTHIPVTGYFGSQTLDAVKNFQTAHASSVLQPWIDAGHRDVSLSEGTGYVYVTTLATINDMQCR
jgi:hypothetical protein